MKGRALTLDDIQRKSIEYGFHYWRASDAHGVTGHSSQAVRLLEDLIGVEVEIEDAPESTCRTKEPITGEWMKRRDGEDLETWSLRVSFRKASEEMDALREALGMQEDCDYGEMVEMIETLRAEAEATPSAPAVDHLALVSMANDMRAERTYLGSCRETCDNSGKLRWDRVQRVIDYLERDGLAPAVDAGARDERKAFEAALRETYQMVDPFSPPLAGTYARGEHEGIIAALKTIRENFNRAALSASTEAAAGEPVNTKPLLQWRDLYDAINQVTAVLGCHGSISARDDRVLNLMACLKAMDGGEYTPGMMPPLVYASAARAAALEEAAEHIDSMNDSAGDRASYDNREMHDGEVERMHALSDAAKAIRALAASDSAEGGAA